jgi:acetamidase/formamidase
MGASAVRSSRAPSAATSTTSISTSAPFTVYLPVFAKAACSSTGDGHGVQGDGESTSRTRDQPQRHLPLTVHDMKLNNPRAETATHWITHGFDPDLDDAAKALRDMIRLISADRSRRRRRLYAVQPQGRPA